MTEANHQSSNSSVGYRRRDLIGKTDLKFCFFYGHTPAKPGQIDKSYLSQWRHCHFTENGIAYFSTEQYMMAAKARLFHDEKILEQILAASHPSTVKKLGRQVKNFNPAVWEKVKFDIVCEGNRHKFGQNANLKEFLLDTGSAILVEASPYDRIWGIGMGVNHPDRIFPERWKGENLLGFTLTKVRDDFLVPPQTAYAE